MTKPHWAQLKDNELLQMRICHLGLGIEGTELEERIRTLHEELAQKNLVFRPLVYLADEWFTPDEEITIGIPFYLAHPRLIKLEETMMLEAEGSTPEWCMRLLRHEAGHAIAHAYRLPHKKEWKKIFGDPSKPYDPETYKPRPYSQSYVVNLQNWYAQSHPEEDFAETFAVWLNPSSDWRHYYKGWKALRKLDYIDRLMKKIGKHSRSKIKNTKICEASRLRQKLQTYYQRKRALYQEEYPDFFDADLKRIFTDTPPHTTNEKASKFIAKRRQTLIKILSKWARAKKYTINKLLKNFMHRCAHLNLHLAISEEETMLQMTVYLTTLTTNYLHTGKFKKLP